MHNSLRFKLIAPFIIGTLALTIFLAWYTYDNARQAVEDSSLSIAEVKTSNTTKAMSVLFKSTLTALQNLTADHHVISLFAELPNHTQFNLITDEWLDTITQEIGRASCRERV